MSFKKKSVRRIINLTKKKSLELELVKSQDGLREFYLLFCLTRKRLGLPPIPYRFFRYQWKYLYPQNYLSILLCRYKKKAIGGLLILKFNKLISLEYSGENIEYRRIHPIHFLYWQAIKIGRREGYKKISFGRTSKHNRGLIAFKNNWGTRSVCQSDLYQTSLNIKTFYKDETSLQYKLIKGTTQKVPMFLAKILGQFCYRHLG